MARQNIALIAGPRRTSLDKDGVLQFGEKANKWPARHLSFGHEGGWNQRVQNQDIKIGCMICNEEDRLRRRHRAMDAHAHAEQTQKETVIKLRDSERLIRHQ